MTLHDMLKQIDIQGEDIKELDELELQKLHARLMTVIQDFSVFTEEHKIQWALGAGNMLGAVRLNGFIPWDDDIDITMTREEFNKLLKVFPKDDPKYYLRKPGDSGYILHYPRLYVRDTKFRSFMSTDEGDNGLYIDIFIDENAPNNIIVRKLHGVVCTVFLGLASASRVYYCRRNLKKYLKKDKKTNREFIIRLIPGCLLSVIPMERWMKWADNVFSLCKNTNSKYIVIPSGARHYFGEIYDRTKFCTYTFARYESIELPIPVDPNYYLTLRYGKDYMEPPKKGKRERRLLLEYEI